MRKPRPEAFDPKVTQRRADEIDLSGIVALQPQKPSSPEDPANPLSDIPANSVTPRYRDTTIPSHHDTTVPSDHGITTPRHRDTDIPEASDLLFVVRKAVKQFGKEAATHRFTQAEKQAIAELVFHYKARGIRTSENEIARIAINYLVHDYHLRGERSVLHQCLVSLNQ
jgi:hypothetical protein